MATQEEQKPHCQHQDSGSELSSSGYVDDDNDEDEEDEFEINTAEGEIID